MQLEFHHINFVSTDVNRMHEFYTSVFHLSFVIILPYEKRANLGLPPYGRLRGRV